MVVPGIFWNQVREQINYWNKEFFSAALGKE
jgi:hypothetical protein